MSANAEDEAKARLEVAQLYEEMGQGAKAVRYLIAAAEIYRDRGDQTRMREVYQRVLAIEPANAQAAKDLGAMHQAAIDSQSRPASGPGSAPTAAAGGRPQGGAPGAAPLPTAAGAPPGAGQPGRKSVMVPTPWVGRDPKFLAAVRAQITAPPDKMLFPFNPLPRINDQALAAKAEARREKEQLEARKNQTRIDSSFAGQESRFSAGAGAFKQAAGSASAGAAANAGSAPAAQAPAGGSRFAPAGDIKGGNRDLADMIRKRMENK